MTNLEKTWSLTSARSVLQLQLRRHWRASYFSSPRAQFMEKTDKRKTYTVLRWNALSRSWRNLPRRPWSSTTLNTPSTGYVFNSRRLWSWTTTTLRRGVTARFVCSSPIPSPEESGLIYSATLVTQHKRSGSIYHGAQRTTSKPTHVFTAKGKKNRLLYTI